MRTLLFILLPICSFGQIYVDSYKFAAGLQPLLDAYPGAEAAYSLRLLDADYTGNCIKVRRKSNGDSTDIGFVNGIIDTASLKTFCGTGATDTCFVIRWYSQVGSGRDGIQYTAAQQPRVLTSGVVNTLNNLPAIVFDGLNDRLITPDFAISSSSYSVMTVSNSATAESNGRGIIGINSNSLRSFNGFYQQIVRNNVSNNFRAGYTSDGVGSFLAQSPSSSYTTTINLNCSYVPTSGNITYYRNGSLQDTDAAINQSMSNVFIYIGTYFSYDTPNYIHNGNISEIIIYASDQSSNRTGIESNINAFYSIY